MSRETYIFTSESVSEGHPDKVCDRISDAVLDAFIALEPEARVACETFATTNRVVVGGEVGLSDKNLLSKQMDQIDECQILSKNSQFPQNSLAFCELLSATISSKYPQSSKSSGTNQQKPVPNESYRNDRRPATLAPQNKIKIHQATLLISLSGILVVLIGRPYLKALKNLKYH